MSPDEQTILGLTRENASLRKELEEAKKDLQRCDYYCTEAGMPTGFEDGNSWDDYDTTERVSILAKAYLRASAPSTVEAEGGEKLLLDLSDPNVQWIFSLMCFQCGPIAHVLQRNGHDIEKRAKAEQPYVMTWLLKKYHEFGKCADWRSKIDDELNAMERARKAANPPAPTPAVRETGTSPL